MRVRWLQNISTNIASSIDHVQFHLTQYLLGTCYSRRNTKNCVCNLYCISVRCFGLGKSEEKKIKKKKFIRPSKSATFHFWICPAFNSGCDSFSWECAVSPGILFSRKYFFLYAVINAGWKNYKVKRSFSYQIAPTYVHLWVSVSNTNTINRTPDWHFTKTKKLVELEKLRVTQRGQLLFAHHPAFNTTRPITLLAQAYEAFFHAKKYTLTKCYLTFISEKLQC